MKNSMKFALTGAAIAALAACGGGGGGGDGLAVAPGPTTPVPEVPTTTNVAIAVVDGALQNALVCLDANRNGVCDSGETQGKTDATGRVTLAVPNADVGKHRVLAVVGTDAVDATTGPVTVAYTLKAPADQTAVVSPFTSLIERVVDATGATSAQAETNVRTQLGLTGSLFDDYSAASDKSAATIASTLVQITQQLGTALAASVGQPDSSGGTIAAADIATEITNMLLDKLTTVRHTSGQANVKTACAGGTGAADCKTATAANATYFATNNAENKLTAANIGVAVGVRKQIAAATPPANPVETGVITWFSFNGPLNWEVDGSVSNAAEATPVNGAAKYRDFVTTSTNGTVSTAGTGGNPVATDLHWSGSAWTNCPAGYQSSSTVRDAKGFAKDIDYCNGSGLGVSQRATVSIAGKSLAEVVNLVKAYPYTTRGPYGTPYAFWGPTGSAADITASLGSATFPDGASILYQGALGTYNAPAYTAADSNAVTVAPADVAAGGDVRANPALACNATTTGTVTANLEEMIARNPGKACILNPGTQTGAGGAVLSSGAVNEGWGNTTVSMGSLGSAPVGTASTATTYYTTNTLLRVAFAGNGSNAVTFYECQQRTINGGVRNCVAVGTGSYSIATLGDARTMSFSDVPGISAHKGFDRVFVERGGKVYYGYQSKLVARNTIRLNLTAVNALIAAATAQGVVGMTPITP